MFLLIQFEDIYDSTPLVINVSKEIYIYIYVCLCVCVCVCSALSRQLYVIKYSVFGDKQQN